MSRAADFPAAVKRALADRAGRRCCFLGCSAITVGPSDEGELAVSNSGVACHISAASIGGRRYLAYMSTEERQNISNGIWMCATHATEIDRDDRRFSVDLLTHWKRIGEAIAQTLNEHKNLDYNAALALSTEQKLLENGVEIKSLGGGENLLIGNAIYDSAVPILWGDSLAHAVMEFLIEVTRNAFQHGQAKTARIEIRKNSIILLDDGFEFDSKDLLKSTQVSGGIAAAKGLIKKQGDRLILLTERREGINVNTLLNLSVPADIFDATSCVVELSHADLYRGPDIMVVDERCGEVFVILPRYVVASDIYSLRKKLPPEQFKTKPLTFLVDALNDWNRDELREIYPDSKVIVFRP